MRSPARSLPFGTMAGIITLLIAASLTWYVCSGLIPWEYLGQAGDAALRRGAGDRLEPSWSCSSFVGTIFSTPSPRPTAASTMPSRAWFSMGRDRYMPIWFGAVHPRYRTPYRSIVFLVPIALVLRLHRRCSTR